MILPAGITNTSSAHNEAVKCQSFVLEVQNCTYGIKRENFHHSKCQLATRSLHHFKCVYLSFLSADGVHVCAKHRLYCGSRRYVFAYEHRWQANYYVAHSNTHKSLFALA